VGETEWSRLTLHEQADAIYREFRVVDAQYATKELDRTVVHEGEIHVPQAA
jgi:hypothetical protein